MPPQTRSQNAVISTVSVKVINIGIMLSGSLDDVLRDIALNVFVRVSTNKISSLL